MGKNTKKEQNFHEDDSSRQNFHEDYSSRIKKLYIQLHDYQYYHCPYEEIHGDKRFIGRETILGKLKSLFSNAEYLTGAYLITGYRGSGKTSLVNKAISDLENKSKKLLYGNRLGYVLILLFYFFVSFFFFKWLRVIIVKPHLILNLIPWVLIGLIIVFLLWVGNNLRENIAIKQVPWWTNTHRAFYLLYRVFIIKDLSSQDKKNITAYLPWYCLILLPISCCLVFFINDPASSPYLCLKRLCLIFYLLLMMNVLYNIIPIKVLKKFTNKISSSVLVMGKGFKKIGKREFWKGIFGKIWKIRYWKRGLKKYSNAAYWKAVVAKINKFFGNLRKLNESKDGFINFLKSLLKFRTTIFIKINLGHSRLREVDILKLLARNLRTELIKYYGNKTLTRVLLSLAIFYFVYTLTYLFYYQPKVYSAHYDVKSKMGFIQLFSSQDTSLLAQTSDTKLCGKIETLYDKCSASSTSLTTNKETSANINFQHKTILEFIWEKISNTVYIVVAFLDAYFYISYSYIRKIIFNGYFFGLIPKGVTPNHLHMQYTLIPYHIDYFFFLYIFCLYSILKRLLIHSVFKARNPKAIIRKINDLNDIIVSEVTTDKVTFSSEHSSFNLFSFLSPRTKKRNIADVREIEKYLMEILNEISQIQFPYSCPDIVVVFDELDKIETHSFNLERTQEEKKESDSGLQNLLKHPNSSFTIDGTRERQQTLQLLFSNLKYFLSDAKAKFIFIAGREMYDASLADISDRNYFMGSIFHDVINVNSFLSDKTDRKPFDITSMIEKYVCQFIIHPSYIDWQLNEAAKKTNDEKTGRFDLYTLQTFNKFLIDSFGEDYNETVNEKVAEKIIARQKREKVVNTIQHFIIYLTHASNGAPKKVTNYFENFIEFLKLEDENKPRILVTLYDKERRRSKTNPYLIFNYIKQHEIGLINYITLPIILSISNHIKNYSDKLLVSATFLYDHLLKFHRNGFSWRNVEYIPEILEINRTPELRGFISEVLNHLLQTHVQVVLSGLYTYRFNQRLSNEISFLSRISEEASASFNFTLDESLSIKHYYQNILSRLEDRYKKITSERTEYIHSIAMVHTILGDIYFNDEEYNDAIIEYMDSIQHLRYNEIKDENHSQLLVLIRNMLRLGLAFEKRKTYSSAYETYNELCYILIRQRDIDLHELGLIEKIDENGNTIIAEASKEDLNFEQQVNNPRRTFREKLPKQSKAANKGFFSSNNNFINKLTNELNPTVEKILGKISSYEGLRLIYQPLLARTQIMEKSMLGGITNTDVFRVEMEFAYLQKAIDQKQKYLIKVEFYNKLADILFFKRGSIKKLPENISGNDVGYHDQEPNSRNSNEKPICSSNCNLLSGRYTEVEAENSILKNLKQTIFSFNDKTSKIEGPQKHCITCTFYLYSLKQFVLNSFGEIKDPDNLKSILSVFNVLINNYNSLSIMSNTSVRILGGLISDIADAQFGCSCFKHSKEDVKDIENFLHNPKPNSYKPSSFDFTWTGIMYQYYFAAKMYKKANDMKEYVWQLTKILYVLKEYLQSNQKFEPDHNFENLLSHCEYNIVRRAIRGCWASYENTHMNEVEKQKRNISEDVNNRGEASLNRSSVNSDVEEINLLFSEIRLMIWDKQFHPPAKPSFNSLVGELYFKNLVSPYSETDTIINRISRLNYKVKLNFRLFKILLSDKFKINVEDIRPFNDSQSFTGDLQDMEAFNELELLYKNEGNEAKREVIDTGSWYIKYLLVIARNSDNYNKEEFILKEESKDQTCESEKDQASKCEIFFQDKKVTEVFSHLIADSMYCLNEIIEIANSYGRSYLLNNFFIGKAHERMVFWSIWYLALDNYDKSINRCSEKLKPFVQDKTLGGKFEHLEKKLEILKKEPGEGYLKELKENLNNYLGSWMDNDALESHSIIYHAEMAVKSYHSAIETHIGGKSYRYFIDKMYFLNDDFNDKFSHFFAALERYCINDNKFEEKIASIKKFNEISKLFQYKYFTETHTESADRI